MCLAAPSTGSHRSPLAGGAASSHSPILKAQLSAPLRSLTPPQGSPPPSPAVATPVVATSVATSVVATPSTATTSTTTQGSSNLIKSLLANKVRQPLVWAAVDM